MSLVSAFLAHAEARPDAPAIVAADGRVTSYGDLARASAARAAAYARQGIGQGDRVLIAQGVSAELYAVLIALFRLGAVAVFPEPSGGLEGVRQAVAAASPKAMVGGWRVRLARPVVPALSGLPMLRGAADVRGDGPRAAVADDAPALITFTSGSTGAPKGIVRSTGFLLLQHRLLEGIRRTTPQDVDLISLPVFILSNLAEGAASVIPAGDLRRPASLDGAALRRQIERHGVNRVVAPPAVCARLIDGAPAEGLTAVFTGGGPVFPNLLRGLSRVAPSARIHAVYGSTEAEPIASIAYDQVADSDWTAMASGVGLLAGPPIAQARVEIVDDEIQVSGPHVNRGYLDPTRDADTKVIRDGVLWHRTGDAGRLDAGGRLWLLGRRDAAHGGLFPFAVETAALAWPGVKQAALISIGDRPILAVAGETLDLADLRRRAASLGELTLARLAEIPFDRRHQSKIDYGRLRGLLDRNATATARR